MQTTQKKKIHFMRVDPIKSLDVVAYLLCRGFNLTDSQLIREGEKSSLYIYPDSKAAIIAARDYMNNKQGEMLKHDIDPHSLDDVYTMINSELSTATPIEQYIIDGYQITIPAGQEDIMANLIELVIE